jgi:hypothetical protein
MTRKEAELALSHFRRVIPADPAAQFPYCDTSPKQFHRKIGSIKIYGATRLDGEEYLISLQIYDITTPLSRGKPDQIVYSFYYNCINRANRHWHHEISAYHLNNHPLEFRHLTLFTALINIPG